MRILFLVLIAAASTIGCSVSINEGEVWDDDWDDWDDRTFDERAADVCEPYCIDLIECGALSDGSFLSCRELCIDRFEESETQVTEGCACIQAAQCNSSAASQCDGDPLPGVLDGAEPGTGGAGNSSGGGDYSVDGCESNHDCALGEDCINGGCAARCVASCQCEEGQACADGYCAEPEEPAVNCESDCDCTSGQSCVAGACQ